MVKRYVQNYRLAQEIPGFNCAPYEGVSETWFDKIEDALNLPNSEEYKQGLYKDEPNFMAGGTGFMMTRERFVLEDQKIEQDDSLCKVLFFLKRNSNLSLSEFEKHWEAISDTIAPQLNLVRFVQCYILPETYDFSPFDGVVEMWWSDLATFEQSWSKLPEEQLQNWHSILDEQASMAMLVEEGRLLWY